MDMNTEIELKFYESFLPLLRELQEKFLYSKILKLNITNDKSCLYTKQKLYKLQEWNLIIINEKPTYISLRSAVDFGKIHEKWERICDDPFTSDERRLRLIKKLLAIQMQKPSINLLPPNTINNNPLLKVLGNTKKTLDEKRIAKEFIKKRQVFNWVLARCIHPTILEKGNITRKFRKYDYVKNENKYNSQIQNRLDILNHYWEKLGCCVKFKPSYSELIKNSL